MSERWKMNRIGFVNFWVYKDDCFNFEDGKLLLRGQNGSGKSITTQSFIPFILDGDRSPNRLDPFGSQDRKMEYYFLLDGQREDATGYLYLEFKKEESDEYITIGIGQHAHAGRAMTFWGFVILDGRRIGYDINLYRQSGKVKIPYEKNELKKILGENTPFTDSSKQYKEYVNKYLFGFERIDQYEQFVDLLIKVRSPKLSKEFKPTKVYEILNESLQTLSDDDIRSLVQAMEKMDSIQQKLSDYKKTKSSLISILKEYKKYNAYLLNKKASRYKQASIDYKNEESLYHSLIEETEHYKEKLSIDENEKTVLEADIKALKEEIAQYLDPEMENIDRKLSNANLQSTELNKRLINKNSQIENKKSQIYLDEKKVNEIKEDCQYLFDSCHKILREMDEMNSDIQGEFHSEVTAWIKENKDLNIDLIKSMIKNLNSSLINARESIKEYGMAEKYFNEAKDRENEHRVLLESKEKEKEETELNKQNIQDAIITSLEEMDDNLFYTPDTNTLSKAVEIISSYENSNDMIVFNNLFRKDFDSKLDIQKSKKLEYENRINTILEVINKLEKEYQDILSQKDMEPERDSESKQIRELLKEKGIEAVPFYKTVTFNDRLSEERKAVIESALTKAGLLDALVVSEKDYHLIKERYPELLDVVIHSEFKGNYSFNELLIEENLPKEINTEVNKILSGFGKDFVIDDNGIFCHGLIEGRGNKKASEYVGVLARKRKKEELLRNKQLEIDAQENIRQETENSLEIVLSTIEGMNEEYDSIPDLNELNNTVLKITQINLALNEIIRKQQELENNSIIFEQKKNEKYQDMIRNCRNLPYSRSIKDIDQVIESLSLYREDFNKLHIKKNALKEKEAVISSLEDTLDNERTDIDLLYKEKDDISIELQSVLKLIENLKTYLNNPEFREKALKLENLHNKENEYLDRKEELSNEIAVLNNKLDNSEERINRQKDIYEKKYSEYNFLKLYFEEELSLNLLFERGNMSLDECVKEALKYEDISLRQKTTADMLQRLNNVYNSYNSELVTYNPSIESVFDEADESFGDNAPERSRQVIKLYWNGQRLLINNFNEVIENKIAETELLIKDQDREIFEDILSQTIAQKLTSRIDESRSWVKEMSKLMSSMDTSMGLYFSLDWKPVESEADEMDIKDLEKILTMDKEMITSEDEIKVANHFRVKISKEKQRMEDNGEIINYLSLVREVLDYRKWFEFRMKYSRPNNPKQDLTNARFNRFSGGEKAMAMYVPLFAAVNAQYKKALKEDHPRIIALDEAFAGVDDKNIESMFMMVEDLDFDYIMNSQVLWGCYRSVKRLRICELLRPLNSSVITVINYIWNGKVRYLDEF